MVVAIVINHLLFIPQINDLQGRLNSLQQMAAHGPPPNQWGPQGGPPPPPSSGPMMPPHPGPNMSDPNMPPQMVSVSSISLRVDILNCICRRFIYIVNNYLQEKRFIYSHKLNSY